MLFIHTPKTAGTSFRHAAEQSSLVNTVLCDYGRDNPTNTPVLNQARYHSDAPLSVEEILASTKDYMLTGHFSADRYLQYFYPYQVGIFLRDPIQRVISNYFHKVRKEQIPDSLEDYIETRQAINLQFRYIGNLPLEYFGFIGISERFQESLALVNKLYNLDLKAITANTNPAKNGSEYEAAPKELKRMQALNKKELEQFQIANKLLDRRLEITTPNDQQTYGAFWINEHNQIQGRAYRANSNKPVQLVVEINEKMQERLTADQYNPIPFDVRQPRNGHMGFVSDIKLSAENTKNCRVICATSGYRLIQVAPPDTDLSSQEN